MTINENTKTGGYSAVFEKDGKHYLADISFTLDKGPECMIFSCDKEGNVNSWEDLYTKWFNNVTKENLIETVNEFMEI